MDLAVATTAEDVAGLGVLLAQDLFRVASDFPNFEKQINRIAQSFISLNLALADLSIALHQISQAQRGSLSPSCLDHIRALLDRIQHVPKHFKAQLRDSSGRKRNKKSPSKLERLMGLFPGPEAAAEMQWMTNTTSLLATIMRLSIAQESSDSGLSQNTSTVRRSLYRNTAETLCRAVIVYARAIEEKLAAAEKDGDASDGDDEPLGPGALLFKVSSHLATNTPKGKAAEESKQPVTPSDAADWIYLHVRSQLSASGSDLSLLDQLSAAVVDWLLQEMQVIADTPATEAPTTEIQIEDPEPSQTPAQVNAEKPEATPVDTEPPSAPTPPKASSKKKAKKGKLRLSSFIPFGGVSLTQSPPEDLEEGDKYKTADEGDDMPTPTVDKRASELIPEEVPKEVPEEVPEEGPEEVLEEVLDEDPGEGKKQPEGDSTATEKPAEAFGSGKKEKLPFQEHDHGLDDLPPPYPHNGSGNSYMSPGRAPFVNNYFPVVPSAPFPPPGTYGDLANMAYAATGPAYFQPVGFYPVQQPYCRNDTPFPEPRALPESPYNSATSQPVNRHSVTLPFRGGPVPPRRKQPSGTVLDAKIFHHMSEEDDEETNDTRAGSRRRKPKREGRASNPEGRSSNAEHRQEHGPLVRIPGGGRTNQEPRDRGRSRSPPESVNTDAQHPLFEDASHFGEPSEADTEIVFDHASPTSSSRPNVHNRQKKPARRHGADLGRGRDMSSSHLSVSSTSISPPGTPLTPPISSPRNSQSDDSPTSKDSPSTNGGDTGNGQSVDDKSQWGDSETKYSPRSEPISFPPVPPSPPRQPEHSHSKPNGMPPTGMPPMNIPSMGMPPMGMPPTSPRSPFPRGTSAQYHGAQSTNPFSPRHGMSSGSSGPAKMGMNHAHSGMGMGMGMAPGMVPGMGPSMGAGMPMPGWDNAMPMGPMPAGGPGMGYGMNFGHAGKVASPTWPPRADHMMPPHNNGWGPRYNMQDRGRVVEEDDMREQMRSPMPNSGRKYRSSTMPSAREEWIDEEPGPYRPRQSPFSPPPESSWRGVGGGGGGAPLPPRGFGRENIRDNRDNGGWNDTYFRNRARPPYDGGNDNA